MTNFYSLSRDSLNKMGIPKSLSRISPASAEHNKGVLAARLGEYASKPIGKLGPPPKWMTTAEKKIWRMLARSAPAELGQNDRTLMEMAVSMKAKLETHTITTPELSQLFNCLKALGFIPVDRKAVAPPKVEDEFDRFETTNS
jgi:hypothetical protein